MPASAAAARSTMAEATRIFRLLNFEQRLAAVGALLLGVSTFGPFSFVELAELTIAVAVLALLRARGLGKEFHLPFGDGTVIAAAGIWAALLIVVRLFDRPLGQNLLALVCAALLVVAGVLERAKRPADDLPAAAQPRPPRRPRPGPPAAPPKGEAPTEPLPPPEFKPYKAEPGQQLHLGGDEEPQPPPDDA
jgi:hypothetical protein